MDSGECSIIIFCVVCEILVEDNGGDDGEFKLLLVVYEDDIDDKVKDVLLFVWAFDFEEDGDEVNATESFVLIIDKVLDDDDDGLDVGVEDFLFINESIKELILIRLIYILLPLVIIPVCSFKSNILLIYYYHVFTNSTFFIYC